MAAADRDSVTVGTVNRAYLDGLRERSAYPVFRTTVDVAAGLGYLAAFAAALVGVVVGLRDGGLAAFVLGVAAGAAFALLVRVGYEASQMLVDIADAVIDAAACVAAPASPAPPAD